jgi:hypothetical protein
MPRTLVDVVARKTEMILEEFQVIESRSKNSSLLRIFNLDLHIAVNRDVAPRLRLGNARLTTWSISRHNHLIPGKKRISDPVAWINSRKWMDLSPRRKQKFIRRYRKFLNSFDGFLVTHTPSFSSLYLWTKKPILVLTTTRYESPFTLNEEEWRQLDKELKDGVSSGHIFLSANNQADAEYLKYFSGLDAEIVPSLCVRTHSWNGCQKTRLILARDTKLIKNIEEKTIGMYSSARKDGRPYEWEDLCSAAEVLYIPQNVSTMTLFELTAAGIPVAIPSMKWMTALSKKFTGVLDELSFIQVSNEQTPVFLKGTPADPGWSQFYNWWISRADWMNSDLMPNVRIVTGIDDLVSSGTAPELHGKSYFEVIERRNARVLATQEKFVNRFLDASRGCRITRASSND